MKPTPKETLVERPPIVAILGHVDHGKSTLLDYIRKTNTVTGETGGITQHVAAYEVAHKTPKGETKRITFIDTPGHAAFGAIRSRSARMADIAILIVSAEDGVKAQTLEALSVIRESEVSFIVAINKTDSPKANVDKTINELAEHQIFLEGRGGNTPYTEISAKTGAGVPELLELILLVAELEELHADPTVLAEGFVVEAHRDPRKGVTATLLITNGTLAVGTFAATRNTFTPVRGMEDSSGTKREEASFASPVIISGWSELPQVGEVFKTFEKKKDMEGFQTAEKQESMSGTSNTDEEESRMSVPLILKADVQGSLDALQHEINVEAEKHPALFLHVIRVGVGSIGETDIKAAAGDTSTIILGFGVTLEEAARELAERRGVAVQTFDIIYKLSEWLDEELVRRTPKSTTETIRGAAVILKTFSKTKHKQIVGGRVETGELRKGDKLVIKRRGEPIGAGRITELQQQKATTGNVQEGKEFGMELSADVELVSRDTLDAVFLEE